MTQKTPVTTGQPPRVNRASLVLGIVYTIALLVVAADLLLWRPDVLALA